MWSVCNSPALLVELQNGTAVLLQFLIMLNKLLYHTAILPLSINPREGKTYTCIKICTQTSLAVQWLKLHASTAGSTGSIPGEGTKIPHCHTQKKSFENFCLLILVEIESQIPNSLEYYFVRKHYLVRNSYIQLL